MPEFTEQEPLAQAFFQLRFEAPHEIVPPGVAAARRTVARRRTVRVAAASVLATAVLVGAGYLGTAIGGRGPAPSGSQPANPNGPTLSDDELEQLGVTALRQFGVEPTSVRPGTLFGPVHRNGFTYGFGNSAQPFPAGDYDLRAVCVGTGSVEVSWSAPGTTGTLTATCDGGMIGTSFVMAGPGIIGVQLAGDDRARDRAGIAVMVTDPLEVAAVNALPKSGSIESSGSDLA